MRQFVKIVRWIFRSREILLGLLLVGGFVLTAAAAPLLAPESLIDPSQQGLGMPEHFRVVNRARGNLPQPPSSEAVLGTSGHQVDVYYSLVWGARNAFEFGLPVALGAALLGCLVGGAGSMVGGWSDWLLMRLTDGFLTFPLIAGVVMTNEIRRVLFSQTADLWTFSTTPVSAMTTFSPVLDVLLSIQVVFILLMWMPYARLVNGMLLRLKGSEFVLAAQMVGAGRLRIILRHLIPNSLAPIIVMFSRDIGTAVLLQAALTFTHFGSGSVWGDLLSFGRDFIMGHGGNPLHYWWVFLPPSLVIILFGIGWSLLGDGLNEWLNPKSRFRLKL